MRRSLFACFLWVGQQIMIIHTLVETRKISCCPSVSSVYRKQAIIGLDNFCAGTSEKCGQPNGEKQPILAWLESFFFWVTCFREIWPNPNGGGQVIIRWNAPEKKLGSNWVRNISKRSQINGVTRLSDKSEDSGIGFANLLKWLIGVSTVLSCYLHCWSKKVENWNWA